MSIRKMPLLLSLILSAVILFGGWLIYKQYFVEQPIQQYMSEIDGVETVMVDVTKQEVEVTVSFTDVGHFLASFDEMKREIDRMAGEKEVLIHFPSAPEMEKIWQQEYFKLAEVVELRHYSQIPEVLNGWKDKYQLHTVHAQMDDQHIMVVFGNQDELFYKLIPRPKDEVMVHG